MTCFGATPASGNAALVIEGDHATDEQRQQFARASQRSACVFIDPVADGDTKADWVSAHALAILLISTRS